MQGNGIEFYRLEYNETQGGFHCDDYTHKRNTHGWLMLSPALGRNACLEFIQLMNAKYWTLSLRGRSERGNYPTFWMIRNDFWEFIETN